MNLTPARRPDETENEFLGQNLSGGPELGFVTCHCGRWNTVWTASYQARLNNVNMTQRHAGHLRVCVLCTVGLHSLRGRKQGTAKMNRRRAGYQAKPNHSLHCLVVVVPTAAAVGHLLGGLAGRLGFGRKAHVTVGGALPAAIVEWELSIASRPSAAPVELLFPMVSSYRNKHHREREQRQHLIDAA